MAKVSAVERNLKRQRMVAKYAGKRALLKNYPLRSVLRLS